MVKRKRAKASTAAKKKVNDKKKDAKPSKLEETNSENASISRSQNSVYDSSSSAKKAKFDPCQSPSPKKSKKYVPPFTASQRVSPRSRKSRINSEKSEKRQNCEEETKVCLAAEHVFKTEQGKANSPERSIKEVSEELLESIKNKTDEKLCKTSTDVQQCNVEMKIEIIKENDDKTDAEIAGKNASETAQKETSAEVQGLENLINKSKDENSTTPEEIGEKNGQEVQEVGNVSGVTKALHRQIELNGGCEQETRENENLIGNKRENLEEGVAEQLEKSVDTQMSVVIGPGRDHVETGVTINGSDVSGRIDNVEVRLGYFDARLSDVGGKINVVTGVPFLSDVCAGNKYVSVIDEEPDKSEISQSEVQKTSECDPKTKINGTHKERKNGRNVNNEQRLAEEKRPNKNNNLMLELQQHRVANLDMTNKQTTFYAERTIDNFGPIQTPSSNEIDDTKAQMNLEPVQNEPMNKPVLCCQEIIKDKLSEMLAIVTESNNLPSSQITYINGTNSSPTAESNEKCLGDPFCGTTVVEAEITSTENACEKYSSYDQKKKCLTESVVTIEGFVSRDDGNSQDEGKRETSEMAVSVDSKCVSVMIEKVKDVGDAASSVDEYSDKRSQNAAKTEIIEMKECQCGTMSVDNEREQTSSQKVEDLGNSGKSDKHSLNTPATETESKVPSSERSETMDEVGNNADKITDDLVRSDKVIDENDQEVPSKMSTSPEQELPDETLSKIALKDENNVVFCSHNEATSSVVTSSGSSTADISHNTSKTLETTEKTVDVTTSGSIDEQSYTEEFRALEELLPADDIGLFDDVMMSQTKSTSVNNELPSGDNTIEFLINELKSLHCMVASYERAVRDVKRQYNSNARF